MALSAHEAIPKLLEQLLDHAAALDAGKRSPHLREIEDRTDEIATLVAAQADFMRANMPETAADQWDEYHLTKSERIILNCFLRNSGRFIPRETVFNSLYAGREHDPLPKIVDVFLTKIRRKIAKSGYTIIANYNGAFKFIPTSEVQPDDHLPPVYTEWHGVLMGNKQAQICDILHSHLGKIVLYEELTAATGDGTRVSRVTDRMYGVREHLLKTSFEIVTIPGQGYRMQLRRFA